MELFNEAISISKIMDGIFIGDMRAGINLDLLMKFKISHIINATGMQLPYTFESLGVKYLNIEWSENPPEEDSSITDEVVSKITTFIDESLLNGEGLFGFSFNGKNRICVVVILYLMTKFLWPLKKCLEYVNKKKLDMDINTYYKNQLTEYEKKLFENNNNHIVETKLFWNREDRLKDNNELLMRNTYMNEVKNYNINYENKKDLEENKAKIIRHVEWGDNKKYARQMAHPGLIHYNIDKDLFLKKNIEDINDHIHKKPIRSCIKNTAINPNVTSTIRRKKKNTKIYVAADTNQRKDKNSNKDLEFKEEVMRKLNNNNNEEKLSKGDTKNIILNKNFEEEKDENKEVKDKHFFKNDENNENHLVNNLFITSSKLGENDSDDEIKLNNIINVGNKVKENHNFNKNNKLLIKKANNINLNIINDQNQKVTNNSIKPTINNLLKLDPKFQTLKNYLKENKKKSFISFSNTIPDFKINITNKNTNENINSINISNNSPTISANNNNNDINSKNINLIPIHLNNNSKNQNKETKNKNSEDKKKNGIYLLNFNLNIDNRTTFNIKNNFFNNGNNSNSTLNKKLNNFFTDSNGNTYFNSFNKFKNIRSNKSEKKDTINNKNFFSPNINYYLGNPKEFLLTDDIKKVNQVITNFSTNKNSYNINNQIKNNKKEKPKIFKRPTINIDKNNINNMINNNKNILINNISNPNAFNKRESKFNLII